MNKPEKADFSQCLHVYEHVPPDYFDWMAHMAWPHVGRRVLETGIGPGVLTRMLLEKDCLVTSIDISPAICDAVQKQTGPDARLHVVCEDAMSCEYEKLAMAPFDTVLSMNFLEHIQDDAALVRRFHDALCPGGKLVVLVPAHPFLYGSLDSMLGHFRRYTRARICDILTQAGFRVTTGYFNFPGIFGWWWQSCVRKKRTMNPTHGRIFGHMLPAVRRVESRFSPCIGLSIIAVGEKSL